MKKQAFTLIELLVVIAIIAILAAILFPVFAQAKLAAKKTVSISNQKQINLSLFLYQNDYDDMYPHNDDCVANSSLDPTYNNVTNPTAAQMTAHCNASTTLGGFSWRMNHYAWQKWVLPYTKSVGLYTDPGMAVIKGTNAVSGVPTLFDQGEIANGYALNIAITGAQNTWPTPAGYGAYRNSFVGGTQTGIPSPANALLMTEQWFFPVTGGWEVPDAQTTTYYPAAFREHWEQMFYKNGGTGLCGQQIGIVDPIKVPFGVVPVGFADGHVKAMPVGAFLAATPTYAAYTGGASFDSYICPPFSGYYNSNPSVVPAIAVGANQFPMWGL